MYCVFTYLLIKYTIVNIELTLNFNINIYRWFIGPLCRVYTVVFARMCCDLFVFASTHVCMLEIVYDINRIPQCFISPLHFQDVIMSDCFTEWFTYWQARVFLSELPPRGQRGAVCFDCGYTDTPHTCLSTRLCRDHQVLPVLVNWNNET